MRPVRTFPPPTAQSDVDRTSRHQPYVGDCHLRSTTLAALSPVIATPAVAAETRMPRVVRQQIAACPRQNSSRPFDVVGATEFCNGIDRHATSFARSARFFTQPGSPP